MNNLSVAIWAQAIVFAPPLAASQVPSGATLCNAMSPKDSKDWIASREMLMRGATAWRQTQKKDYDEFRADLEKSIETLGNAIIELSYKFQPDKKKANACLMEVLGLVRITDELKHMVNAFKAMPSWGGDARSQMIIEDLVKLMRELQENSIDKLHLWSWVEGERVSLYREEMALWRKQIAEAEAQDNKPLGKKSRAS